MELEFLEAYIITKRTIFLSVALAIKNEKEDENNTTTLYKKGVRFNLHRITLSDSKFLFRFKRNQIVRLKLALEIPDIIRTRDRSKFTGEEGETIVKVLKII